MANRITITIVIKDRECVRRRTDDERDFDEREFERLSTLYTGSYLRERMRNGG